MKQSLKLDIIKDNLLAKLRTVQHYSLLLFIVFIAALYGFIFWRINTLNGQQPSSVVVNGQVQAAQILQVNQAVVNQLQSLQDNSVSVQTLFDQARTNPFNNQ